MPKFKNDPILVLILSICTCGIYLIYWNMKMAEVMNAVAGKEVISSPIAIVAGCCYPVNAYFYYLIGNDCLYKLSERVGEEPKDNAALFTFLGLLIPMVAPMMVQGEVNKLYQKSHTSDNSQHDNN